MASRIWVELNNGEMPKELEALDLKDKQVWAMMEMVRPYASKALVDKLWAEKCGLSEANIAFPFGQP